MEVILTCTKNYKGFTIGKQYKAFIIRHLMNGIVDVLNDSEVPERFTKVSAYYYFVEAIEHREDQISKILEA